MKKVIKSLMFFAAAAMAFTSCDNTLVDEDINVDNTYSMTFIADAPQSRTSVSIVDKTATFAWGADEIVAFIQWDNEKTTINKKQSDSYSLEGSVAQFGVEFDEITNASGYNYIAIYPSNGYASSDEKDNYVRTKIAASQNLTEGTFDPNADLMISKPINNVDKMTSTSSLEFARVAAVAKMTLKGVTAGEKIKSVTFIWGAEKKEGSTAASVTRFTGRYQFDLDGNITSTADDKLDRNNYVELTSDVGLTAIDGGTDIYFTCFPGEYSGLYTVEVITDQATYSKSATLDAEKALCFTSGNVLSFGLGVARDKSVTTMSFASDIKIDLANGTAVEEPNLTLNYLTLQSGATEEGLTYASSNEGVATVDAETGEVTIVAVGTTTITATYAGNNEYTAGEASYTITVSNSNSATKSVTYTVTSTSAVSISGDAPSGSTVSYTSTYRNKFQLTEGNSMTLTLEGWDDVKITGLTLSMRSNKDTGAGSLSAMVGETTFASIAGSFKDNWYGSWSSDYVDIKPTVTPTAVGNGEDVVITIAATTNSLYCQSFTIEYEYVN